MLLVNLKPWPYNYKNALTLRYGADRNATRDHMGPIVNLQREILNGNCGSWYLIPGNSFNDRMQNYLSFYLQETAMHAKEESDHFLFEGITYRSATDADYWRGLQSIKGAENNGASYLEILSTQVSIPRPVLIGENSDLLLTNTWVLPLHFPLEGSTSDTTTACFDRLIDYFIKKVMFTHRKVIG